MVLRRSDARAAGIECEIEDLSRVTTSGDSVESSLPSPSQVRLGHIANAGSGAADHGNRADETESDQHGQSRASMMLLTFLLGSSYAGVGSATPVQLPCMSQNVKRAQTGSRA